MEGKTSSAILAQKWFKIEGPECRQCITAAARLVRLDIESNCLQLLSHIRPFHTYLFSKKQAIYERLYAIISVDAEHLNQSCIIESQHIYPPDDHGQRFYLITFIPKKKKVVCPKKKRPNSRATWNKMLYIINFHHLIWNSFSLVQILIGGRYKIRFSQHIQDKLSNQLDKSCMVSTKLI